MRFSYTAVMTSLICVTHHFMYLSLFPSPAEEFPGQAALTAKVHEQWPFETILPPPRTLAVPAFNEIECFWRDANRDRIVHELLGGLRARGADVGALEIDKEIDAHSEIWRRDRAALRNSVLDAARN